MTEFLIYQGKTAVILAVFYMFYRLLLSKDTFHRFNRIVLLATAVLSFVLPLCVITIHEVVMIPAVQSTPQVFENATIGSVEGVAEVSEPICPYVLCSIFALGAFSVLVMTIISIAKVIGIIAGCEHHILESGETLVITDAEIAPFSWMKYIVLSREDYESGYTQTFVGHTFCRYDHCSSVVQSSNVDAQGRSSCNSLVRGRRCCTSQRGRYQGISISINKKSCQQERLLSC